MAALVLALLGLVAGSTLGVVVARLPAWLGHGARPPGAPAPPAAYSPLRPRSQCPACGHALRPGELIPLLSWLVQRGRCRACGTRIPARYPALELAGAALGAASGLALPAPGPAAAAAGLGWLLAGAALIDRRHFVLPDIMVLPGLWAGLLVAALGGWFAAPEAAILGAAAGYLSLWALYHGHRWLTGRAGLGAGDFKLFALAGAWLGWQPLPWLLVGAAGAASLAGGLRWWKVRRRGGTGRYVAVPFGPFLAAATWLALLLTGV